MAIGLSMGIKKLTIATKAIMLNSAKRLRSAKKIPRDTSFKNCLKSKGKSEPVKMESDF